MPTLKRNSKTKYLNLAEQLRTHMMQGTLSPGDKLPTFAQLKAEYGLGQTTLEKTYNILEAERLIVRRPGRGTFVAPREAPVVNNVIAVVEGVAEPEVLGQHPFYNHLLGGIRQAAKKAGVKVMLLDRDAVVEWDKLDGALLMDEYTQLFLPIPLGTPRVSLLRIIDNGPSILTDDYSGCREATEYLLSLGHRRIAFLTQGRLQDSASNARLRGYQEALQAAGIEPPASWVRNLCDAWVPTRRFQYRGHEQMRAWLQEGWSALGCTAILAQNDETAVGIQKALIEAGLKVPGDVSVVGFDGTEIAEYASPSLTTVKIPLEEIGARGVDLLMELVRARQSGEQPDGLADKTVVLPPTMRIGESTGRCPA